MWKRSVKFWGGVSLQSLGICMGLALVFLVFFAGGSFVAGGLGIRGSVGGLLLLYPYYLTLMGVFYMSLSALGCFRSYLPLLVSFNVTRKQAICGILLHHLAVILGLVGLGAFVWFLAGLLGGEAGGEMAGLIWLMGGTMLLVGSFGIFLGTLGSRWGKLGQILGVAMAAVMGGVTGAGVAAAGKEKVWAGFNRLAEGRFLWFMLLGLAVFALVSAFAFLVNRKMEVRN